MAHRIVDFRCAAELLDTHFLLPDGAHIIGARLEQMVGFDDARVVVFLVDVPEDAPDEAVEMTPAYRSFFPSRGYELMSVQWRNADGSTVTQSFEPKAADGSD